MKKSLILLSCVLAVGAAAQQESGEFKKRSPKTPVPVAGAPVTEAEAAATFHRVSGLMKSVLKITVPEWQFGRSSKPVSRLTVAAHLMKLYKATEPWFVLTPKPIEIETARISAPTAKDRHTLEFLAKKGFVGNYGPLATGKLNSLTVQQFGDSVGLFVARIAECTHTPSAEWTPYLHGN